MFNKSATYNGFSFNLGLYGSKSFFNESQLDAISHLKPSKVTLAYLYEQKLRDHEESHSILMYGDANVTSGVNNPEWTQNDDSAMHRGLTCTALKAVGGPSIYKTGLTGYKDANSLDSKMIGARIVTRFLNYKKNANAEGIYTTPFIQTSVLYIDGDQTKSDTDSLYYYFGIIQNIPSHPEFMYKLRLGYRDFIHDETTTPNYLDSRLEFNYLF